MLQEQAPTLNVEGVDLKAYADSLIERYCNTALKHRTWQIAMDGTMKLPQRMLDSVRWHLTHGGPFECLALGVAGWMRYVGGIDDAGNAIEIKDPMAKQLTEIVASTVDGEARVNALLAITSVFGEQLPLNATAVTAIQQAYASLQQYGAKQSVARLVA